MAVPNNTSFSLLDVINELPNSPDDLLECFAISNDAGFDPAYKGSKNQLLNFRNYNHNPFNARKASTRGAACSTFNIQIYFSKTSLSNSTRIYSDSSKTTYASAGFYYDGTALRYWNGSTFTSTIPCATVLSEESGIVSGLTKCDPNIYGSVYRQNGYTLANCPAIWTGNDAKNFCPVGWYEVPNSNVVRFWNGSSFTSSSTC